MREPSISPEDAGRVVVPFLPALREKLDARLSPPTTQLVVTASGSTSRLWRGVGAIWKRLVVFSAIGVLSGTLMPHAALASEVPTPGSKDARVRNVNYDPDQVVSIQGSFRHAIEIQFGPGEIITQAALGDTISWQIAPVGNIVFLKPREKAGPTNLIVVTNANGSPRTYHFNLTLGTGQAMYGVRFHYPREERALAALQVRLAEAQAARTVETNITASALDHAAQEKALARHHRTAAVRAHLLELAGDRDAASEQYRLAARLTLSLPEQRYLQSRLSSITSAQKGTDGHH